jgi:UDP-N-acetylmuramyl pentapeptide phosphotransferase/UDP-N-acetylglucosamine-1-phosphate transferase
LKQVYWFLLRGFLLCLVTYAAYGTLCSAITSVSPVSYCGFIISFIGITTLLSQSLNTGLCKTLRQAAVLDTPNERSMHTIPVPRGGGWSFIMPLVVSLGFALLAAVFLSDRHDELDTPRDVFDPSFILPLTLLCGVIAFTAISWLDDRRGVSARWRLLAQIIITSMTLFAYQIAATGLPFSLFSLPIWPELWSSLPIPAPLTYFIIIPALIITWCGFINFYNFMDGIDGITAVETISLSGGILVLTNVQMAIPGSRVFFASSHEFFTVTLILLTLLGCSIGFLRSNWHPAKIFLGDIGSITIGYLLGFCLLAVAAAGYWYIALTLPLYYLADGGLTLLRRLFKGEKIWQAHRTHFYQRAAQAAGRHDGVVLKIALCNLTLTIIAGFALVYSPWICATAPLPVALLLHNMANQRHSAPIKLSSV